MQGRSLLRLLPASMILAGALSVASAGHSAEVKSIAILVPEAGTDYGWNQQGVEAAREVAKKYNLEFMPAEGKTPLTDRQVEIIRWWIAAGVPNGGTVGELQVPDDMRQTLSDEVGVSF